MEVLPKFSVLPFYRFDITAPKMGKEFAGCSHQ